MGGAAKAVGGVVSDAVGVASAGTVDLKNKKLNLDPTKAVQNYSNSSTLQNTQNSFQPEIPEVPQAEDPATQAARAKAESDAKLDAEAGERAKGLSSTILGGSTGDDKNLKKKKLLGE